MVGTESPARSPNPQSPQQEKDENGYPPQRHAGAVGLGPEFGKGAGSGDKMDGMKEQLKGKILHKPDLVQHGRDLRTGELKRKQQEEGDNPFQDVEDSDTNKNLPAPGDVQGDVGKIQAAATAPEGSDKADRQVKGENTDRVAHIG